MTNEAKRNEDTVEPLVRPVCPVCHTPAVQRTRTEQHDDGPGATYWAYMECPACGLRSREVIGWEDARAKLIADWTPNAPREAGAVAPSLHADVGGSECL